jgi:hypothetical protein
MQRRSIGTEQGRRHRPGRHALSVGAAPREADRVVHAALDAGVTLIDTADAYSVGRSRTSARARTSSPALRSAATDGRAGRTKGGHTREPTALDPTAPGTCARPRGQRGASASSAIGSTSSTAPIPRSVRRKSVGALASSSTRDDPDGRVSNADPDQIRSRANPRRRAGRGAERALTRASAAAKPEVDLCEELGIAFLPWSPLGGIGAAARLGGEHAAFGEVARERGVSPQQVCLAWLLARSPVVVPIPGSSRPETIRDSAAAAELVLGAEELDRLG